MEKTISIIELRHLRYFVAASEHGSFRQAGLALGVRESAISRRVRDLEDRTGASLFVRHHGGVCLTLAGQRFLCPAREALKLIDHGVRDVAAVGQGDDGRIRVGIFSSLASGFLSDLFRAYDAHNARVQIDFMDGDPAEHVAAVRQFQLDVAFVTGTRTWFGCDTVHLWSEGVFAVLPEGHALAAKEELDWTDLAGEVFVVSEMAPGQEFSDCLIQRLAELGHHLEIRPQRVGRDNLMPLVAIGRGLTVISEAMTAARFPGVVYRRILGDTLPFSAVWSPRNDNPACRRLLSLAKSHSKRAPS